MKLFFENISAHDRIQIDSALESSVEQALEIFENLPQDDGSSMGLVNEDNIAVLFQKYNRFMWLVEIPIFAKNGSFQVICTPDQCKRIIKEIFDGADPFSVADFTFESYLD